MLRRFRFPSSLTCLISTSSPSLRAFHHKSVGGTDDPFGEKAGWDGPLYLADWRDVDIDGLVEAIESPDIQKKHFGPDYVRARALTIAAAKKMGPKLMLSNDNNDKTANDATTSASPSSSTSSQHTSVDEQLREADALRQEEQQQSNNNTAAVEEVDEDAPLSKKLTPAELRAAKFIMLSDDKIPSRLIEQEDTVSAPLPPAEELAGYRPPEPLSVPKSIRPKSEEKNDIGGEQQQQEQEAAALDSNGLPLTDPLKWDTEQIIKWIEIYGPSGDGAVDPDILDAFRMIRVDGNMLLNKVMPPDLFKIMRKWHVKRVKDSKNSNDNVAAAIAERTELVSLTTLQETVILCFPYGPP